MSPARIPFDRLDAEIEARLVGSPMAGGRRLLGIELERLILHRVTRESADLDFCRGVLEGLRAAAPDAALSIDTRKPAVAKAAFAAGARLYNDVSALTYDPSAPETAAALIRRYDGALCLMHAQGDPRTMQRSPNYRDVLVEVAQFLAARMEAACAAGVPRARIIVDPGVGFGKTLSHNLSLLRGLGALHSLGAPILLGASRKRFIGALSGEEAAEKRAPGSIAAALQGVAQGAQIVRVHDAAETVQAVRVWMGMAEDAAR